jgi:Na+-transporting NADH:ubiquinone oxidoreductase subunit NqrB
MKDLDLATLVAVLQELLGWTLWAILAASVLATLAFLYVLVRDRGIVAARLVGAELVGVLGGIGAVAAMFLVTSSSPADMGGPVDWLLAVGIFVVGLVGTAIGAYALMGLVAGAPATVPAPTTARGRRIEA